MGTVHMEPGCTGKSNTNNLPAPTDLTENPYGKNNFLFKDATQKSDPLVRCGIVIESETTEPIFEKCPHLREKGGGFDHGRDRASLTFFSLGSSWGVVARPMPSHACAASTRPCWSRCTSRSIRVGAQPHQRHVWLGHHRRRRVSSPGGRAALRWLQYRPR
jgi:hypothetical protein